MTEEAVSALMTVVGMAVSGIRRVFYVFQGEMNTRVGALEVEFASGKTLLIDSGPDGECLAVVTSRWEDPFAEDRLTPENRDFVARSGKWTAVDVSRDPEYLPLIGARVDAVQPIRAPNGKVVGVILRTEVGDLRADVEADDLYVQHSW